MEDAVMLFDGQIVPISAISDNSNFDHRDPNLLFFNGDEENGINRDGRVRRFKKGSTTYMAIFDVDSGLFIGYYSEKKFWNNNFASKNKKTTEVTTINLGEKFSYIPFAPYSDQMKVYFCYKFISEVGQEFKLVYNYQFIFYNEVLQSSNLNNLPLHTNGDNLLQVDSITISNDLNEYTNYVLNKEYLLPDEITLNSLNENQKSILFEIVYVWNELISDYEFKNFLTEKKLYAAFEAHINLPLRYNIQYGSIDPLYHKLYNEEYFARLHLDLIDFRYWILNYKENYNEINENEIAVCIINLFPPEELSYLDYEVKIKLLNKIIKENFWIIGNWGFNKLNDEQAIIKIIRSIAREESNGILNYLEIDEFMDLLNTVYDYGSNQTLYEVLYDKVNDSILFEDDGNGNRGQLVKAIYNLWQYSKFNPYHEESSIANNALSHFVYTPYNCRWQVYDSSILLPVPDEKAAPMIINYESDKVLLWYIDNFKFEFYKNKIIARDEVPDYGYQPYGVYSFFQPLSVKSVNGDGTIIKMPVLNAPTGSDPNQYIKNCIPAFYLMYIDELGDKSDGKETIGTAINVVLTFWGIGGVIANLRHIRNVSLVARLGALTAEEQVLLWRGVSGLASASEAFFGAASFFHDLATSSCTVYYNSNTPPDPNSVEYQEYKQCQSIDAWLFAFEMLSMSGNLLARRAFKRASRELAQNLMDDVPLEHRQVIDELAEIDSLLFDFLESIQTSHPNVYNKVTTFATEEKKFAFMYDFQGRASALDELNSSHHLIDDWAEIEHLLSQRSGIRFLKNYNYIKQDVDLLEHIFKGHVWSNGKSYGVHTKIAEDNGDAIIGLITEPRDFLGYYKCRVSVKDSNNNFIEKLNRRGNAPGESTFFPDSWIEQRIIEEMSLAYVNKIRVPATHNQWRGIMSDGGICAFGIDGSATMFDSTTKIVTAFPIK